jgi:ABC-type multidrug transport system fused ATPase/permease subunit
MSGEMSDLSLLVLTHDMPLWVVGLIMVVLAEVFSVGLMLLSRYAYGISRLSLNNEIAGFKFAVVGVFYAVMLAFVVVAVWEDYSGTEDAVRNESKATVDLYRVAFALPEKSGREIQGHIITYVQDVRKYAWSHMAVGKPSEVVSKDLEKLSSAIFAVQPKDDRQLALYLHALRLLTVITDNRNERLDSANGSVPGILWFVLLVGGAITLAYPAFFAASNLMAQILMTASLAALVALSLLLGLAFDFPFTGDPHISVDPFDKALEQMPSTWPSP